MSTAPAPKPLPRPPRLPLPFDNGDRMTQAEFHRRYASCPKEIKAELIGGVVYMASPLRWLHGNYHPKLTVALEFYAAGTPGVELGDNATMILGKENEPQPDLALRILQEFGGQSRLNDELYVVGAPELLAEIAHSTRAIDLHQKRDNYQQAGVIEYLVVCLEEQEVYWFDFRSSRPIKPNREGLSCSRVFPGLWIDGSALLARNSSRLVEVVQQGLASREHAAFVKRLQAAHRKHSAR